MIKKILLVLTISILMLSISGCTDEVTEETPVNAIPEGSTSQSLVPADNLPQNYEFLGSLELSVEKIGRSYVPVYGLVGGYEGLYMYLDTTDVYVDVIELDSSASAENFIAQYKASFTELSSGERFTELVINDNSATRIVEYSTIGKDNVPRYTYIWSNDKFVFVVGGATDDYVVLSTLAESTGY
ncbi:hypothetical protein [Methanolobus psychrotolerans]|uniref:hypothetical protein n=1 Tax=Methanolobus psychrotolerans TaxID=1874706 RepID=UPI000B91AC6B|nr:hypothetical protein [Methanolobus psychrotolerans]